MSTLLLKQVIFNGKLVDVLIEGNRFKQIASEIAGKADKVINAQGRKALIPPFYNTHTHAAMTLLRGYADDLELFTWLKDYIWKAEAKLTEEDVYCGTRLAILEMIRSGTVFFSDMYWHQRGAVRAATEMGVRAAIGLLFLSDTDGKVLERNYLSNEELLNSLNGVEGLIQLTYAPHAIYTVAEPVLRQIAEDARQNSLPIHIHASETLREVEECRAAHAGLTPIEYLDKLGLLGEKTILAHCTHLTDHDIELIHDRRSVIAHMPCSNMKLCSGAFRFHDAFDLAGCRVTLGTDGASSNNNLSMLDEMKFAALLAKHESGLPTAAPAAAVFDLATRGGAEAFDIDGGVIEEGKLADAVLVNLDHPQMLGDYNLVSNLVYSADSSVIDTVICDGRVLMENRLIENETEILDQARACCRRLAP